MIAGSGAAAAKGLKSMREDGATEVAANGAASEGSKEQAEVSGDACAARRSQPADGRQQDIRERSANLPSTQRAFSHEQEPVSGGLYVEIEGALPLALPSGEGSALGGGSGEQAAGAGDASGSREGIAIESLARAVKGALFVAAESGELEGLLEDCATRRSQPADGRQQDEQRKDFDPSRFTTEDIRERNANLPSTQRAFSHEQEPVSGDLCMGIQGTLPLAVPSVEGSARGGGSGEQAAGAGDASGSREGIDVESLARAAKGALSVAAESGELDGLLEACATRRSQPADGRQEDERRERFDPSRFTTDDIRERNANLPSTQRAFSHEQELGSPPTTASSGTAPKRSQPADGKEQDESQITVIVD